MKRRLSFCAYSYTMKSALFIFCFCLGVRALGMKTSNADDEQMTTTVSMSLIAKTVSATSITRFHRNANGTKGTSPTPDIIPITFTDVSVIEKPSSAFINDNLADFHKIKSNILLSNLKNGSDLLVLSNEKKTKKPTLMHSVINITEGYATMDEDGNVKGFIVKNEKTTAVTEIQMNQTQRLGSELRRKKNGLEGRSLENASLQQNATTNFKKRMRVPLGMTERSTTKFESFMDPQIFQTSNRLVRPPSTISSPSKKLISVSPDKFNKNTIKLEPTSQTDWKPIVPERLSIRPMSIMSHEFIKLKPIASEKGNSTLGTEAIVFPSENRLQKEGNVIPMTEPETSRTTEHKNNVEKSFADAMKSSYIPGTSRLPIRFRGAIRYKSNHANESLLGNRKYLKKIIHNKTSIENSEMEIPVTGASWTLATLKGSTPTITTENMKEISPSNSKVNDTIHVFKSQKLIDNDFVALPAHIKLQNASKELKTSLFASKNEMTDTDMTAHDVPSSVRGLTTPLQLFNGWNSKKIIKDEKKANETEVVIPGSVEPNQSSETTPFMEIVKVKGSHVEITPIDVITENPASNTNPLESITISNDFKFDETATKVQAKESLKLTSQNVTYDKMEDVSSDVSSTTEIITTTLESFSTTSDSMTLPTFSKTSLSEEAENEDSEIFTEVKSTGSPLEEDRILIFNSSNHNTDSTDESLIKVGEINTTISNLNSSTTVSPSIATKISSSEKGAIPSFLTMPATVEAATPPPLVTPKTILTTLSRPIDETHVTNLKTVEILPEKSASANVTNTGKIIANHFLMEETASENSITTFAPIIDSLQNASTLLTTTTYTTSTSMPTTTATLASTARVNATTIIANSEVNYFTSPSPITTPSYKLVFKPETTEESVYYENYIPTTISFRDEITEENVPAYLRLTVQTISWKELCTQRKPLREAIIKMLNEENATSEAIHFLNLSDKNCQEKIEETRGIKPNGTKFLPVNMFLMDKNGDFDKNLSEAFLTKWGRQGLDFDLPIRKVDFVTPIVNLTELYEPPLGGSVIAAIVISCVAGICVILLGILFVIMKRRQKRFNYGQRCTPVSLDAYSLDSVSIYNSVRRKGMRASKRSYGNAAFDDPEVPSHPMNFAGLANFSAGKEQLYEEFNIIPQVFPKVEELPEKTETKNRYANVIPLPETRVHLSIKDGDPLSDYINANYVRGIKGMEKMYIACQAPMESTIEDFWRMIWEQQCKVILMITDLQENGVEKCADYLPPNEVTDNLRLFGDYQVTLKKRDVKDKYIISNLNLKNMETNLWREVTHLWYLGWPEQGVPSEANSLIAFLIEARSQMKSQNGTTAPPAVVHCSPGTGRTGTVIACDLCIKEYEQNRMVDIPKCVFNLRRDRAGAVQTKDQYAFIYEVLNMYATKLSGGGIESI